MTCAGILETPFGPISVLSRATGVERVWFGRRSLGAMEPEDDSSSRTLDLARTQLHEYAEGLRTTFQLPLALAGASAADRALWTALAHIPYGATITYGELAGLIGRPGAARSVAAALGRNPLPIVLPCHRVVGQNGSLGGFGPGVAVKQTLLELEGGVIGMFPSRLAISHPASTHRC